MVKTVDVGQQRTAGGANSAVEVGTVPGRQAVQGLLAGWPAQGCFASLTLSSSKCKARNRARTQAVHYADVMLSSAVLYFVIVS